MESPNPFFVLQIIWELSGDVMEDLSTPLLDMANRKLSEPNTNCANPFGPKVTSTIELLPATTNVSPEVTTTNTGVYSVTTSFGHKAILGMSFV